MFDKKSKVLLRARKCRKRTRMTLQQVKRSGPYCVVCATGFTNSISFEDHLRTREHKMMESPLELILQRLQEAESPENPVEYENLLLQVARPELGQRRADLDHIDISGIPIGADCIQSVQVFFCGFCNTFIPEDGHPDLLRRHSLTHKLLGIQAAS